MDIATTLEKWYEAKEKMSILEKKIQKYKDDIAKEMKKQGVKTISENGYIVQKRNMTKTYLSKDSVPTEIWKKYSTQSNYDCFVLKKE